VEIGFLVGVIDDGWRGLKKEKRRGGGGGGGTGERGVYNPEHVVQRLAMRMPPPATAAAVGFQLYPIYVVLFDILVCCNIYNFVLHSVFHRHFPLPLKQKKMAELPPLTIARAGRGDLVSALELIANSIAQQRQLINSTILYHPLTWAAVVPLYAGIATVNHRTGADAVTIIFLLSGVTIALLSMLARYTSDYLTRAENVGCTEGLKQLEGKDKDVVVAKWGDLMVGACVVRYSKEAAGVAEVWAWTVKMRYRGTGLGKDLLNKAVEVVREKKGKDCKIVFAEDHANSYRIKSLPTAYTAPQQRKEERARKLLQELCRES